MNSEDTQESSQLTDASQDPYIRLDCLKMALEEKIGADPLERAREFYEFVTGS